MAAEHDLRGSGRPVVAVDADLGRGRQAAAAHAAAEGVHGGVVAVLVRRTRDAAVFARADLSTCELRHGHAAVARHSLAGLVAYQIRARAVEVVQSVEVVG